MKRFLITGATGNVGREVIRFLFENGTEHDVVAAVRDTTKAAHQFTHYSELKYRTFDMEDPTTFPQALKGINRVFLLRPPHISSIKKYYVPLLQAMKKEGVQEVLLLSVQGAERSAVIPHRQIEKLLMDYGFRYIFLRPGYFMQNLTTTLLPDIRNKRQIVLPAGKAKFNWVDVQDIGEAAALQLERFNDHGNKAYELTGYENLNFYEVANQIQQVTGVTIAYRSVGPLRFFLIKKREGMPAGFIMVMLMLHLLPRFQKEPRISNFYESLSGKKPNSLKEFLHRERNQFK